MTADERRKALEQLAAQAKESVIVKVLERIATELTNIRVQVAQLREALCAVAQKDVRGDPDL
jgi:hypothetical protein